AGSYACASPLSRFRSFRPDGGDGFNDNALEECEMTRLQCLLVGSAATEPFAPTPALCFGNELARVATARLTVCILPTLEDFPLFRPGNDVMGALRAEIERVKEVTRLAAFETQKLIGNRGS